MGGMRKLFDRDGVEIGMCGGEQMLIKFGGVQPSFLRTG
jgi:hypothetical protein